MKNWKKIELQMTCAGCPEQYDALIDNKIIGYLRLRHGYFYVDYYPLKNRENEDRPKFTHGKTVYEAYPNGDGSFTSEERKSYLKKARKKLWKAYEKEINLNAKFLNK